MPERAPDGAREGARDGARSGLPAGKSGAGPCTPPGDATGVAAGGAASAIGARRVAEAVARRSYGRLVAYIAARTRDVALAEDALADAFRIALERWPVAGVPRNPEGWLVTVARRQVLGRVRHQGVADRATPALTLLAEERMETPEAALPDERLKLMFACTHPAIDAAVHAPLMLQTVLGFDAAAIGAACLVPGPTMGQRLVRAKAKIRAARIPFAVPDAAVLPDRLPPVLDAVYATFGLAWDDPAGRRDLAEEALWLAELLTRLLPGAPEALGLRALLLFSHARRGARRGADGAFVPLDEQDTALWDGAMAARANDLLAVAAARGAPGRYQIEAAIQAIHADRARTGLTHWAALLPLYRALRHLVPTLGNHVGEAAVLGRVVGPDAGLAHLDRMADAGRQFQPWWAVRANLLHRQGADAGPAYAEAIRLTPDPALRAWLAARAGRA